MGLPFRFSGIALLYGPAIQLGAAHLAERRGQGPFLVTFIPMPDVHQAPDFGAPAVSIPYPRPSGPKSPRTYDHLPLWQFRSLLNGAAFAASQGTPLTLHVTLAWRQAADFDPSPRAWLALQGHVFGSLWSWLRYHGRPVAHVWARERGSIYGEHTHLALHLAPELRDDLHRHLLRAGRFTPLDARGNAAIKITPDDRPCMGGPAEWSGLLRYFAKTLTPLSRLNGELVMPALGVDDRGRRPCTIQGKRSGMSRSIDRAAREAADWQELTTLPELRAVLHPGELHHVA